jgi:uncharacterized RDD family membrane protein YckC
MGSDPPGGDGPPRGPGEGGQPPPPPNAMQPAPPVPPDRSAYDGGPVGAGLGPRVGARLLDVLIVAIPLSIVLSLVGWGAGAALDVGGGQGRITALIQSLLWFGYFVWLESSQGATLGKRILGIEVQGPDGGPPSVERAMKRNAWMLLGLIPAIGGVLVFAAVIAIIITINSGSNMQGLHDEWATTAVLRSR